MKSMTSAKPSGVTCYLLSMCGRHITSRYMAPFRNITLVKFLVLHSIRGLKTLRMAVRVFLKVCYSWFRIEYISFVCMVSSDGCKMKVCVVLVDDS
jgi:hypothetical protein